MELKIFLGIIALLLIISSVSALSCNCKAPIEGYRLVGCSTNCNHEGKVIPIGVGDGYVYIKSNNKTTSCEYWKNGVELPNLPEEISMTRLFSEIMKNYNSQMNNLPEIVRRFMGKENIHMKMTKGNMTIEVAAVTENGKITEIGNWIDKNENGNYDLWDKEGKTTTINVYMNIDKLEKVSQSDDKIKAFKEAWGKDIKFDGVNIVSKIKVLLMGAGISIAALIS
jgi:hypothetical protein